MKCLVTGAGGYIGNKLVKRLSQEGYELRALVYKNKSVDQRDKIEYIKGDITDRNSIQNIANDIDFVFHCAALVRDYGPKKIFYKHNFEGTKNLVEQCEKTGVKRFVFLSHIRYESEKPTGHYSVTKALAEEYLINKNKTENFPITIIRPGNVYGPGATTWVLRPLNSIQNNKISFIDKGKGVFLHTYIDNLLDALIASIKKDDSIGEVIDITDGDNSTTWKKYFDDLARIADMPPIKRNLSKNMAMIIAKIMIVLNKIIRIEPWVTPMAVRVLTNQHKVTIEKAQKLLDYSPKIDYINGIKLIEKWFKNEIC
jgi:nucleoside-diphosphate-sugar epimerase